MDSSQFLTALMAIVVIDIVLAGDNAIVIALAARALPPALQKKAIVWGAVGAIAVRSVMTLALVWLLKIPGLMLAGGALLVWIAWQLLTPHESHDDVHAPVQASFWGALKTIVIADATMGLDNVLAVAGASHGSYLLVVLGLAISVPIVVWGSTLVLKLVDRFPAVIYLGAGVLLWTAVSMMRNEPLLRPWRDLYPQASWLGLLLIPLVLGAAFVRSHRRSASRIQVLLAHPRMRPPPGAGANAHSLKEKTMLSILIPVDGSANALGAVRHALAEYQRHHVLKLHLLNVQPRLPLHVRRFFSDSACHDWAGQRAGVALAGARDLLARSGVPFESHWATGERVATICETAQRLGVHHIVLGRSRHQSITRMFEDTVTSRLLDHSPVPVEVVAGRAVSGWERWGLPTGALLAGAGLVWMAAE
jgi:YjbE family integral membrane protein